MAKATAPDGTPWRVKILWIERDTPTFSLWIRDGRREQADTNSSWTKHFLSARYANTLLKSDSFPGGSWILAYFVLALPLFVIEILFLGAVLGPELARHLTGKPWLVGAYMTNGSLPWRAYRVRGWRVSRRFLKRIVGQIEECGHPQDKSDAPMIL